jgi:hypothetical protein
MNPIQIDCPYLYPDVEPYHQLALNPAKPDRPLRSMSEKLVNFELSCFEENSAVFLWAYPELLDWPTQVQWLFSPCNEKRLHPGDLWGMDAEGNLLIVESKRTSDGPGPFGDLLEHELNRQMASDVAAELSAERLATRWARLHRAELTFLAANKNLLEQGGTDRQTGPGIYPYSTKRYVTWRWRTMYLQHVVPVILASPAYEQEIQRRLEAYSAYQRPPHYIGLILAGEDGIAALSPIGHKQLATLRTVAGTERAHVRFISAQYMGDERVRLTGRVGP